jgi:hypothetical protein
MIRTQPDHPYTAEDQSFLQDLADRAALAIANARLYASMQRLNTELEQRVAERTVELSEANALLQTLLDRMPDHIYFKDSQSRFIRNSMSQAKALGLNNPDEAVGKSDFDFFPHAQISFDKEQEIIRSGKSLVALGLHFKALCEGKTSFYTSPIKALASEKFFSLCDDFGPENVGMLTGDASINPNAPVICCTAEVLANRALREGELEIVESRDVDPAAVYGS